MVNVLEALEMQGSSKTQIAQVCERQRPCLQLDPVHGDGDAREESGVGSEQRHRHATAAHGRVSGSATKQPVPEKGGN